ncbi:MAG: InlB B-repeat-containing protein, partial [Fervidobacterium sp.]
MKWNKKFFAILLILVLCVASFSNVFFRKSEKIEVVKATVIYDRQDLTQSSTYTLTVNVSPTGAGTVTLNPSGGTYAPGTVVTLTANPSTGYHFVNWSGDATGSSNPTTVTMNSNKNVTANFAINTGEPKSIHTWLDGPYGSDIYSYDVDLRIDSFPNNPDPNWLYFWALCVYFNDGSAAHGGLQWASGGKKANWGGYGLVGGTQSIVLNYNWQTAKWYRYRALRLSQQPDGSWAWGFWILDYSTGIDTYIGSVTSYGSVINDIVVFTETGYGVTCDTSMQVSWRSPNYNSISGGTGITPTSGYATYNGTCSDPCNTDQRLISTNPIQFIHLTNTTRTTLPNTYLFQISTVHL